MQISVFLTLIVLLGFILSLAPALAAPCKDKCIGCYKVYKTPLIESKEVKLYTSHGVTYYRHQERTCYPWTKQKNCIRQTYCSTNRKCETGGGYSLPCAGSGKICSGWVTKYIYHVP